MLDVSWMRQNKVDILKYLPVFLAKDSNFKNIADACSAEHDSIRLQLQDILNQFFVSTATWGLTLWENTLAITPNANDDYIARRNRIFLKVQANQTSTIEYMTTIASRYFADNANVSIISDNANYAFSIIADAVSFDITGLIEAINTYKPAHLAFLIVHLLQTKEYIYIGGIVQTFAKTKIFPAVNFSVNIDSTSIFIAGIVKTYNVAKLK
ncbi:putative phage tail protein [Pectinatus frisingensis]|uniref:putative phage tail protein n=1 Tax=Pectinatus frisingensis TaxID=865 RepID=UPI0018C84EFF|nr:putative phage tail protein [Pectinatus frisingensis]